MWSLAIAGVQKTGAVCRACDVPHALRLLVVCRACDVPHALRLLVLVDIRDCQGTAPVVWISRRLESVGKRGAWLWKQILFWLTCMVENAVVGMSMSLAEETAVMNGWTAFALASGRGGVWSCRGN